MKKLNLHLLSDEGIILRKDNICYKDGIFAGFEDSLFLTNHNIIVVNRGTWGNVKDIKKIPLKDIHIAGDRIHALCSVDQSTNEYQLELILNSGDSEAFAFPGKGMQEIIRWVNEIGRAIAGEDVIMAEAPPEPKGVMEKLAQMIDGPGSNMRATVSARIKKKEFVKESTCPNCGAPLKQVAGRVVKCEYCDTEQTL